MITQALLIAVWTPFPQQRALSIFTSFCISRLSNIALLLIRVILAPHKVKKERVHVVAGQDGINSPT